MEGVTGCLIMKKACLLIFIIPREYEEMMKEIWKICEGLERNDRVLSSDIGGLGDLRALSCVCLDKNIARRGGIPVSKLN